jgi:hypothetical protein
VLNERLNSDEMGDLLNGITCHLNKKKNSINSVKQLWKSQGEYSPALDISLTIIYLIVINANIVAISFSQKIQLLMSVA